MDHSTALEMLRAQAHASSNLASSADYMAKLRTGFNKKLLEINGIRILYIVFMLLVLLDYLFYLLCRGGICLPWPLL